MEENITFNEKINNARLSNDNRIDLNGSAVPYEDCKIVEDIFKKYGFKELVESMILYKEIEVRSLKEIINK